MFVVTNAKEYLSKLTLLNPVKTIAVAFGASLFLAAMAQVVIPLPFTPVPITGQTFGVALIALFLGQKRATLAVLMYLAEGALGLPVFAMGASGLLLGPTVGYLFGMVLAATWIGYCSDRDWTSTLARTFFVCVGGSVLTFSCGLLVLSRFVPGESLLVVGLVPFLIGDFLKNLTASSIYRGSSSMTRLQK